VETEPKSRAV